MNITAKQLKKRIRNLLPYGIVAEKKRVRFMEMYDEWKASGNDFQWDEECLFQNVVSVESFGNSGASAFTDLMTEYDGLSVLKANGGDGKAVTSQEAKNEIDFLRHTGGLLQLEQAFDSSRTQSYYWHDAAVKQFLELIHFYTLPPAHHYLRPYFFKFIDEMLAMRMKDAEGNPVNPAMGRFYDKSDIYFLKDLSLDEYRDLCRRLLNTIFNRFHNGTERIMLLNAFFADCKGKTVDFRQYVPNLKRVAVFRDPRDVYVIARKCDFTWMPHSNVEEYITWTRIIYGDFSTDEEKEYLPLRFESLILDYDNEVERIERYLNLPPELHVRKRQCLDPDVSAGNIGQWKTMPQLADDFRKIKEAFPHLCW